jgi:hypothetical protein
MKTRRILQISLVMIIGLLLLAAPVYAITTDDANFIADIVIQNSGAAASNIVTTIPINTQALIDGNYVTSDLLNTALQTSGGTDVLYMPGVGADPWVFWVSSIGANEQQCDALYLGGDAMQTGFDYFPGSGGMATADNDTSLELGDNFAIEQKGYVDTSAGSDKNLVYKEDAFRTYVSDTGEITSTILGYYPTLAATNTSTKESGGTSHTVSLPSGIQAGDLLIIVFGAGKTTTNPGSVTWPSGWTELFWETDLNGSNYCSLGACYKIADGGEGSTATVGTSGSVQSSHATYRFAAGSYSGVPECASAAVGSQNPPSLSPSWGSAENYWIACTAYNSGGGVTFSSYPANYTLNQANPHISTSYEGAAVAGRLYEAATEDPGAFSYYSVAEVSNTIAVAPFNADLVEVTATGISSGQHTIKTTADGTNLKIYVDDVEKDSEALGGVSVPNNGNNWSFVTNGSMPYMEYQKIWCPSTTLTQHIIYERDTVFDDQTEYNNDATPTFPSSDPDVTATLQNFRPIKEARASVALSEGTPEMLTETPETPAEFYTEGATEHLPGATLINNLLDAGGIPHDLFWIPFCYGLAAVAVILSYFFLKSMLFISLIGGVIILFFSVTGVIPLWTFLVYGVIAAGVLVSERVFGW